MENSLMAAIRRSRILLAQLANPKTRSSLIQRLEDPEFGAKPGAFDFFNPDGTPDSKLLSESSNQLKSLLGGTGILEIAPIEELPVDFDRRIEISQSIVRLVFERLAVGSRAPGPFKLSEAELNAGIKIFTADFALVRRDCVDTGFLGRDTDGAKYWLVG